MLKLKYEHTDKGLGYIAIAGDIESITADVMFLVHLVYSSLSQKNSDTGDLFKELFLHCNCIVDPTISSKTWSVDDSCAQATKITVDMDMLKKVFGGDDESK